MKNLLGVLILNGLFAVSTFAAPCTTADYKYAQGAVSRVNASPVSFSGYEKAKLEVTVLEVGLCSGDLSRDAFCESAPGKIEALLNFHNANNSTVGGLSEVTDNLQTLQRVRRACAE